MHQERTAVFIDGFNLYHAINRLRDPALKWLDLLALAKAITRPKSQTIVAVLYFSAYANWLPSSKKRHLQYVRALTATGVRTVMGQFKNKDRKCSQCDHHWVAHEEKETDVNIALALLDMAHKDLYDHAFLITNDSDLAPAIRMVRNNFPNKQITTVAPPGSRHSQELIQAASAKATINQNQLRHCLLPAIVCDAGGNIAAMRPPEYSPLLS